MGKISKFFIRLMVGANIASIIVMLAVGYSGRLNPADHPILSCVGLAFPALLLINLFFLLFWSLVRLRLVWIPLLGFFVCYYPVTTYLPLHFLTEDTALSKVKILSYNVKDFDTDGREIPGIHPACRYIIDSNADIVCLQEAMIGHKHLQPALETYPYKAEMTGNLWGSMVVLSRYPILKKERIPYPSDGNLSMAVTLDIDGEEVMVVNNHFQTSGLSIDDKREFREMMNGNKRNEIREESRHLLSILGESASLRSRQIDQVAAYVRDHQDKPLILCGDFNETPISYSHETFARLLTDCYVATGNGVGWSYNSNRIHVRIDNVFCSPHWQPVKCEIDTKIHASDHFPIICYLKKHDN